MGDNPNSNRSLYGDDEISWETQMFVLHSEKSVYFSHDAGKTYRHPVSDTFIPFQSIKMISLCGTVEE